VFAVIWLFFAMVYMIQCRRCMRTPSRWWLHALMATTSVFWRTVRQAPARRTQCRVHVMIPVWTSGTVSSVGSLYNSSLLQLLLLLLLLSLLGLWVGKFIVIFP